jgi:hypothetical protein
MNYETNTKDIIDEVKQNMAKEKEMIESALAGWRTLCSEDNKKQVIRIERAINMIVLDSQYTISKLLDMLRE